MRKILFLLLFIPVLCAAQINRTIWGVTLGQSNKQQVKTMLVNRGYLVKTEPDGSLYVDVNNVNFGGAYWTYIAFSFVQGKLYQVWFQNNPNQSPVKIETTYENLKNSLDQKYWIYKWDVEPNANIEVTSDYGDSKTYLSLSINIYKYQRYISLSYTDLYLDSIRQKSNTDEL